MSNFAPMSHKIIKSYSGFITLFIFVIISTAFFSCTSTKNIPYFKDVPDSIRNSTFNTPINNFTETKIHSNDLLLISIQTLDPQANMVMSTLNPTVNNLPFSINNPTINGFMVDKDGNIEIPLVGKILVAGLTTLETKEAIRKKAAVYYKEPVVNVRFGNFTITVLGEVNRPGTYSVANERITILDALGMAGDLSIFGKRQNVLLIREEDGQRKMSRFDLKSSITFASPYFYLKQGDVIYVEPNKAKVSINDQAQLRNITIYSAVINALTIILSRVNF